MQAASATSRRIQVLLRILQNSKFKVSAVNCRSYVSNTETVSIGEVQTSIVKATRPEYVPRQFYKDKLWQTSLHHLRWIMQKDILGQDMFLIGPPGPRRRNLALQYLQLTNKELEYVALSRDTTESDLKQRREIVNGSAVYFDQSAVRAATEGRILVLEGIDKAERNVLPILNNLLENREMQLEDGRMLIPALKYDKLSEKYSKEELDKWKLVRVHENFRVIAIGLPVPKYTGNPLDPPLRSRFQARNIGTGDYYEWLQELKLLGPNVSPDKIENLLGASFALLTNESASLGMPDFPIDKLPYAAKILENNPTLSISDIFHRLYPFQLFAKDNKNSIEILLNKFGINSTLNTGTTKISHNIEKSNDFYFETEYQNNVIQNIIYSNSVADFCLIGPKGCGKSIVVSKMADILNQDIESVVLYQDITSRDLIQQRSTLDNGDTVWKLSPLVNAAVEGKIAVIDGINRIHSSTLSVLHRLVHDRELQLHNGQRMVSFTKFEELKNELQLSDQELEKKGILKIHPKFRIVALGEPPSSQTNWLSSEVLTLFLFHEIRMLTKSEELQIINSQFGSPSETLQKIIDFAHVLRNHSDPILKNLSGHLSTRQLLRIAAKLNKFPNNNAYDIIETTFMMKFLPSLTYQALENILYKMEIKPKESKESILSKIGIQTKSDVIKCEVVNNILTIGSTSLPIYQTNDITKVPSIVFYDVPQHVLLMEQLLQDFQLGFHLLLVGNQGVGKNKIVDRFLQLLNRPREYIQLHRDTTVHSLTVQPTIRNGVLTYVDSPLVQAVKYGRVLVVDEADKAPTHVTCILKTLVESGQMNLSDGRKIISKIKKDNQQDSTYIEIHPDFRMIVLANRPGFPFLGNDFFGALGDLFSSHAVHNPSVESEINLLKYYGPSVPEETIHKLVNIFSELRIMADQGLVSYPYSTREVVNIVKHLEQFPNADLEDTLLNVFDFDKYSRDVLETLGDVLSKHGFSKIFTDEYLALKRAKQHLEIDIRKSGLDAKSPKHGKEDPNNDPHVGGNTWAGGTGGRDTAGLGGKGGPYRLDKGHKIHQLSDEEKNAVPDHIKQAAREMNRKAFREKLAQIGMSEYDASLYSQFSNAVSRQVQSMRVILDSLQAKSKERQWTRHQTSGEMDDVKLIDGLLGEKNIYRRRKEHEPEMGAPQIKPKILRLVVDVSGSMYRFNSYDGRLDRELEAVVLLMEALEGFETKISYDIIGHSGESHDIKFVKLGEPPKNNKERLNILRTMHAHAQFCFSGDNTVEGTETAVKSLAEEECDEAIVVVLSDANLQRYGIQPSQLARALTSSPKVNAHVVFIGSLGNQAERLTRSLPAGKSFICDDVSNLPQILKQIFSSSIITI